MKGRHPQCHVCGLGRDLLFQPPVCDRVHAPYVKEFPLVLECRLIHPLEIGLHTQFVGEILDIKAEESILAENGMPDIEKVRPILYATAEKSYFKVGGKIGNAFSIGKHLK